MSWQSADGLGSIRGGNDPDLERSDFVGRCLPAERLLAGYAALTGAIVLLGGRPVIDGWWIVALHAVVVYALLRLLPRLPDNSWANGSRAFLPAVALPFIYVELGWLTGVLTEGYFDQQLRVLELALFPSDPSRTLHERIPWKPLGEYLLAAYTSYYLLLPVLAVALYHRRRKVEFAYSVTTVLAVFFFCYLCFLAFPVLGPFFIYDRPEPERLGWFFPGVAQSIVGRGASPGATFPSSHVAAAVVIWLLARRFARPLLLPFSIVVPGLIVGAVYGGFHYAVDALAGLMVGTIGYFLGPNLWHRLGGPALPPR